MDVDQESEDMDTNEPNDQGGVSDVDASSDESENDEDLITFAQIQEFHYIREAVHAVNLTVDEIWACLVALKMRLGISDKGLHLLAELFNLASHGTGTGILPKNPYRVKKRLSDIMPLKVTYVAFCPTCDLRTKWSSKMISHMTCPSCFVHYNIPLENGGLQFTIFNVRHQLQVYFKHASLGRLFRKYRPHYKKLVGDLEPYKEILDDDGIILHLGLDASPVTSRAGVSQLPALLSIGNIPIASQGHYPLMAAMFCAKGPKPSSEILLAQLRREVQRMDEDPIRWTDDLGKEHNSKVYLVVSQTDYTQKCETMQHSQGGYHGCVYCKYEGECCSLHEFFANTCRIVLYRV
jgi:hypothetical protein